MMMPAMAHTHIPNADHPSPSAVPECTATALSTMTLLTYTKATEHAANAI